MNVAVGERITISWESDGAKRCKGNWSRNDLRLNGKISGKLSRSLTGSITVRIACIDGDGNREDDSVVVNISSVLPVRSTGKQAAVFLVEMPRENLTVVEIARAFYKKYPDDQWDFLTFFGNRNLWSGGNSFGNARVRNDVEGIGIPIYDESAQDGSNGRLRSIGTFAEPEMFSDKHFIYNGLLEETFAHTYGVYVGGTFGSNDPLPVQSSISPVHWSPCMSFAPPMDPSIDYWNAYTWEDNKDGTWTRRKIANTKPQHLDPFMLYLAGYVSPDQVPDATLLTPISGDEHECLAQTTIRATSKKITIGDVIKRHSPRQPTYATSPKDFSTAFVLVVKKGETPRAEDFRVLSEWADHWHQVLLDATTPSW